MVEGKNPNISRLPLTAGSPVLQMWTVIRQAKSAACFFTMSTSFHVTSSVNAPKLLDWAGVVCACSGHEKSK